MKTTSAAATLVAALVVAGCSRSSSAGGDPHDVVPDASATACSAVPAKDVESVYGARVTSRAPRTSRHGQTTQTGCVVDVAGEKYTALAVYLWHGQGFADQWRDEVALTGDDQRPEQSYGVEARGGTDAYQTTLVVREREYAVRLLCGPTPEDPTKPVGVATCASLLDAIAKNVS